MPPSTTVEPSALDMLISSIYGPQRQMGSFATHLSTMEGHASPSAAGSSFLPPSMPFGMPGYSAPPPLSSTASTIMHTSASTHPLPIHQINFPHSPSPLPNLTGPPPSLPQAHVPDV
jgi:hypothetical protein